MSVRSIPMISIVPFGVVLVCIDRETSQTFLLELSWADLEALVKKIASPIPIHDPVPVHPDGFLPIKTVGISASAAGFLLEVLEEKTNSNFHIFYAWEKLIELARRHGEILTRSRKPPFSEHTKKGQENISTAIDFEGVTIVVGTTGEDDVQIAKLPWDVLGDIARSFKDKRSWTPGRFSDVKKVVVHFSGHGLTISAYDGHASTRDVGFLTWGTIQKLFKKVGHLRSAADVMGNGKAILSLLTQKHNLQ